MNKSKPKQLNLLKKQPLAYGGELMKTRKGRAHGRILDTKNSMHMVLRSTLAVGAWSFLRKKNQIIVLKKFREFGTKYGVQLQSIAFVGNHLHCQIRLSNRYAYAPFIRALTGAIAMSVTGVNRWNKAIKTKKLRFWDYRPYTRVVRGLKALLTLKDYIQINRFEGFNYTREQARFLTDFYKYPLDYGERAPASS